MNLKDKILLVKQERPSWGYRLVAKKVGCSHNLVKYHTQPEEKIKRRISCRKYKKNHPLEMKLDGFIRQVLMRRKRKFNRIIPKEGKPRNDKKSAGNKISVNEMLAKIGLNPKCYLTGRSLDIYDTSSYEFDHIIPISKGGGNSLDNLGIACKDANRGKSEMTPEEFIKFCIEVLEYNNYTIIKSI